MGDDDDPLKERNRRMINFLFFITFSLYLLIVLIFLGYKQYVVVPSSKPNYNVFEDIFSDIDDLRNQIGMIRAQASSGSSLNQAVLNSQIDNLEEKYKNLTETLEDSPEKAITAKVLTLEQKSINFQLTLLKEEVSSLRNKIDNFILYVIAIPLISLVLTGIVGWAINRKKT